MASKFEETVGNADPGLAQHPSPDVQHNCFFFIARCDDLALRLRLFGFRQGVAIDFAVGG